MHADSRLNVIKHVLENGVIKKWDMSWEKSNVAMIAWLPQASYPWSDFSVTSSLKLVKLKDL